MADTVNQHHSGSGHNINADTVNFGRPEFVLTDAHLQKIAEWAASLPSVSVGWVGSQKSYVMSEVIARYLESTGKKVSRTGGIGVRSPQLEQAVEFNGSSIIVDASK